ncbi:hypothetical protein O6H91_05G102500 [Diphasiastrum complanatum]|uniref:Uncharacterized protein n=1 Tax=Diphasiastrum complanatum TaxID=34168 RepID=A0ACC2DRR7_DIPCM|nr:hypothetical protein O6H91_05G102500 [Diphasiastrum complanatum]
MMHNNVTLSSWCFARGSSHKDDDHRFYRICILNIELEIKTCVVMAMSFPSFFRHHNVSTTILPLPSHMNMNRNLMIRACSSDPPGAGAGTDTKLRQQGADGHPIDHASSWLQTTSNRTREQTGTSQKESAVSWSYELTAATMVTYYGVLHVPLSIGGLSLVRGILHSDIIEPQTKAISLVLLQLTELAAAVGLIESTIEPFNFPPIWLAFNFHNFLHERRLMVLSIGGLGGLFLVMGAISALTYSLLHGQAEESKQYLHEMLSGSTISIGCVFLVYCVITPFLEEYVYRGFVLISLTAYMRRPSAIVLSAVLFSVAHFSLPNAISFFIIGCILGLISNITGNLVAPLVLHSSYNFVVLMSVIIQG